MLYQEIKETAERGGFQVQLASTFDQEVKYLMQQHEKRAMLHGSPVRRGKELRRVCTAMAESMIASQITEYFNTPFSPVSVFDVRLYAECYALAKLIVLYRYESCSA